MKQNRLELINNIINNPEKLEKLKRDVALLYNLGISKKTLDRWICKYYKL